MMSRLDSATTPFSRRLYCVSCVCVYLIARCFTMYINVLAIFALDPMVSSAVAASENYEWNWTLSLFNEHVMHLYIRNLQTTACSDLA